MSLEETDDPNALGTAGDDRSGETADPEVVIRRPRGTDLAPESAPRGPGAILDSVRKDIKMDSGTVGTDAETPDHGQPPRLGLQSGARLKPFSFELPTPLDSRTLLWPRTQPGADFPSPQQVDLTADLMDTVARLWNEVYALKLAPPVSPTPAMSTQVGRVYDHGSP